MPAPTERSIPTRDTPAPAEFARAVTQLRVAKFRSELFVEEMPAPQRIAPFASALSADITIDGDDVGSGRLMLLHDPDGNDAHWPENTLDESFGDACVRLLTAPGQAPRTEIVTDPQPSAASTASGPSVTVDDGSGAYVRSGSFDSGSQGRAYLVDARGNAYQLVGAIVPGNLGYGSVRAPVVPDSWVELLGDGVPLSQDLALCSPRQDRSSPCAGS